MLLATDGWPSGWRMTQYTLLPTNSPVSSPPVSPTRLKTPTQKTLLQVTLFAVGLMILTGHVLRRSPIAARYDIDPYRQADELQHLQSHNLTEELNSTETKNSHDDMRGWSEVMGWKQTEEEGLADLGEIAESRYRLHIDKGEQGTRQYFQQLYEFAIGLNTPLQRPLLTSLHSHLPPNHLDILPFLPKTTVLGPPGMTSYKTIFQTDKTLPEEENDSTRSWVRMNKPDGWKLQFFDDDAAENWVEKTFRRSEVEWAWKFMHRGVLKADFLRYLLPLVRGGVYSDVDTVPIRPIEQWGQVNVEYLDISHTDGDGWRSTLSTHPSVIVAIDVDVHSKEGWENGWPRPLGICQWTLSSAPNHPIFLDAVRRVVNASHVVQAWEEDRVAQIEKVELEKEEGWEGRVEEIKGQGRDHAMNVMEWTGPGLFSDSVMAYILARYQVTWHRLRGLHHPLRIGDIMILPITAFSPGGEPDFRAEQPDSPQANVLHNFRGSWKGDGA